VHGFGSLSTPARLLAETITRVAHGSTSQEIAARLGIGVRTAGNHRAAIVRKLGVRHVVQLVRWAIRSGLVNP